MKIISASSPVFAAADGSAIDCLVVFETPSGELMPPMPFTAVATDAVEYGATLFARLSAGEFGDIAPYVAPASPSPPPEPTKAELQAQLNALAARIAALP